ncbi:hypothetical protein [uncultured Gimesia sp.]|uniref:hypothetical protein n=1 Tax=uncultured Gimesia sp. TaxID=1678688 RepID=UPI0030DA767D|tara:strand:+ start:4926 stop:5273 length:348 start_codon:yes stop_codon:yes gene_type:complete
MDKKLDALIKQLGEALFKLGESELANQWKTLTLDARYDHCGGVLAKIRVDTISEDTVSVKSNNMIDLLLISLGSCRDSAGPEWYGLFMTVTSSMDCIVDFNYDPEREQDTAFFEE